MAVPFLEPDEQQNPAFLEAMKQDATPIRLSEGEMRQLMVPLTSR